MNLKKLLAVQTLALARIANGQQPLTYLGADPDVPLDESKVTVMMTPTARYVECIIQRPFYNHMIFIW